VSVFSITHMYATVCTETGDILHGRGSTAGWLNILRQWLRKQNNMPS